MIIKLIAHRWDLQPTWLVVLGLLGTLNPSPTWYYATPNEFFKLTDISKFLYILDSSKLNMQT